MSKTSTSGYAPFSIAALAKAQGKTLTYAATRVKPVDAFANDDGRMVPVKIVSIGMQPGCGDLYARVRSATQAWNVYADELFQATAPSAVPVKKASSEAKSLDKLAREAVSVERGAVRSSGLKATSPAMMQALVKQHAGKRGFAHEYALQQLVKFCTSGIACGVSPRNDTEFCKILNANLANM